MKEFIMKISFIETLMKIIKDDLNIDCIILDNETIKDLK